MRCRCSDLAKTDRDIETLQRATSQAGKLAQLDGTLTSSAASLSSALGATATPKNLSSLTSQARQLDRTISSKRGALTEAITDKMRMLKDYRLILHSEDRSYHESSSGN